MKIFECLLLLMLIAIAIAAPLQKKLLNAVILFTTFGLVLSVIWNFTFNRRYTFRSAANVPVAMAKVFGFYLVFTPLSTWLGDMATDAGVNEYIVLAVTMLSNFVLEYLFCKFVVYRGQENTREEKPKE